MALAHSAGKERGCQGFVQSEEEKAYTNNLERSHTLYRHKALHYA
jgi:hypothetical protein